MDWLQISATVLVLLAVWRISHLDVRGQAVMAWAQVAWGAYALAEAKWWLALQSAVLLVLAIRAVRIWKRSLGE
ncbi:MAG: hypothetical protein ACOZEN_13975 [Thermodesulfobacteriota bacterium]